MSLRRESSRVCKRLRHGRHDGGHVEGAMCAARPEPRTGCAVTRNTQGENFLLGVPSFLLGWVRTVCRFVCDS